MFPWDEWKLVHRCRLHLVLPQEWWFHKQHRAVSYNNKVVSSTQAVSIIREGLLCMNKLLVLKPSASEIRYTRNLSHIKRDKLQTLRLWILQICLSLSPTASESESKWGLPRPWGVLRGLGCLVSALPSPRWFVSAQTKPLSVSRLEHGVHLDWDGACFCPNWLILECNDVSNL